VTFHAHPDDEAIATGGTMARAAAAGHRVVLVVATRGEHGEYVDGFLEPGEELGERRVAETMRAAEVLGVSRVEFLGFTDSGMDGTATNDAPDSFWQTPVDQGAARLAAILDEEDAEVLTHYDDYGGYGHPDHIQVHRVGTRAAAVAARRPRIYQATIDREHIRSLIRQMRDQVPPEELPPDAPTTEDFDAGVDPSLITTRVDVSRFIEQKRAAMAAHASQIPPESFFLAMPDELFALAFGTEWYIREGDPHPATDHWLFAD